MSKIDNPKYNDNRNYEYDEKFYERQEFSVIGNWINNGAKVIDLGCGNGTLMKYLIEKKGVSIVGFDVSESGVAVARSVGLNVGKKSIDEHETYSKFADNEFDFAVCNVTLQMVMYPEILASEMKRIAKKVIISFPNFAYFGNRIDLLVRGRMPAPMLFGYKWYATGHIHQLSHKDFLHFCAEIGLKVLSSRHFGFFKPIANMGLANLFSKVSINLCEKI